jgi:hypothetical protein
MITVYRDPHMKDTNMSSYGQNADSYGVEQDGLLTANTVNLMI